MAQSYLKRNDVSFPQQPNPRGIYAVKLFEDEDLDALETLVNLYLLALPEATGSWSPHLVSLEYDNYTTVPPMPTLFHVCTITLYAAGTITAPPTG